MRIPDSGAESNISKRGLKIRALHCSVWSRERFRVLAASLTVQLGVNGNFFLFSTNVRTVMALSLKLLNRKYDTGICRASAMRQYPDVHQDRWTFRSVTSHVGSAAGPSSSNHQTFQHLTSVALREQILCTTLNINMNMVLSSNKQKKTTFWQFKYV